MVSRRRKRKLLLISLVLFFMTLSFHAPITYGYGLDANNAELIVPGTYYETLDAVHLEAWYNVQGRNGATLTVVITYDNTSYTLWCWLYHPNDTLADDDTNGNAEITVTTTCDSELNYTLGVARVACTGYINFTLTITLPEDEIPGFNLLFAFFGMTALLGLVILHRRRNIHF